ncbi:flavin-containing monooxygenase [Novosphingobium album (ex Liu et al. 2023)]|uniref:Trimethylamine monooxygenase n=1 Tax=Novosphingobium album (ex Liu et al. 2023) TaxID=3031130 RepID=A0ABT5WPT9_9SPHN|nr:NAD(P)/FAD-dependent oxidoreductase [Novosphingobium album (ex Liu et al. 2023)]MDE8652021.1 NAD(P)/FAD-dependent oxidoreductase [Novosphingobium album (ex Liu et al. 2023)]
MAGNIAIIGAGIAGLCTARMLRDMGYDVSIFEKEPDLGGVWSSSRRYPGLTTQNPRETYAFSDWPMPEDYPEWPSGAQMQAYLQSYADHFGITPHIRFSSPVRQAEPLPDGSGWTLTVAGPDGAESRRCDWLIACNGIFSIPALPPFPGAERFATAGGRLLHTSQFTWPEDARGRHVLVVGYGKSSCDVANAIAGISASTTMVVRHLIWKIPKRIGNVLNFKHLFLNRMGEGLFPWMELKGFEAFLHGPGRFLRNAMLASVQAVIARQLDLKAVGLDPGTPLETIARSTVSLVSDGFYEKVASGQIGFERDAEIAELMPGMARLSNGKVVPADLVICGTGWHQRVDFLPEAVRARVTDAQGNFRLYRSMVPLGVPRLLFNGYNSSFFCQLNAEIGAIWLAALLTGRLRLPAEAAMAAEIDRRLAWMDERTGGKHCKGTNIVPFSIHHIDELLRDMGLALPRRTRIAQWLRTVRASDFACVWRRFRQRAAG